MVDSRCGLHCTGCSWKNNSNCGGCIKTNGHPFHGECSIAVCCQRKGYVHCGECNIIPCDNLYKYSYLDLEHGDKPPGLRVEVCRRWAEESGKQIWRNVLLTDSGWYSSFDRFDETTLKKEILNEFLRMIDKPVEEVKVIFIMVAADSDESLRAAKACYKELLSINLLENNIRIYDVDGSLTLNQAMDYDVIYFTGGNTELLLKRIKETGFDSIVKRMVYANKVYVGVSAGSLIATPNIKIPCKEETAGLCFINAYLSCHNATGAIEYDNHLKLPHISLGESQAIVVDYTGFRLIEDNI